jgi:ribosomal protein S30
MAHHGEGPGKVAQIFAKHRKKYNLRGRTRLNKQKRVASKIYIYQV